MPKKGKGKGKKKGKGDKKVAAPPPPVVEEEGPLDELSKQFYFIQIKDLEQRLGRYQEKSDRLQVENNELQKQLKQQLEDQEQMITFLKRKSNEQAELFVDLEEKLAAVQQAKASEKERYEQQLSQLKEDSQRALDQASVENKVLQGQLEALENFRINKDKMEAEIRKKDALIEKQKAEHAEALYNLEKKAVLDRDRMKKDMVTKVNCVASEFRKVSDLQMAETTKRAIRENVTINSQLQKMSEKTTELISENDYLKAELRKKNRDMEILEFNEKELTRRNISNQKVLRLMKDKAGEQKLEASMLHDKATKCSLMESEASRAMEELQASRREAEFFRGKLQFVEEELTNTRDQLAQTGSELAKMSKILWKASLTIQASLQPVSTEGTVHRENLLATLLDILQCDHSQASGSESQKLTMPNYRPGDLGIVPAPKSIAEGLPPIDHGTSLTGCSKLTTVQ